MMSTSGRYQRVPAADEGHSNTPQSPPPPFSSRPTSPHTTLAVLDNASRPENDGRSANTSTSLGNHMLPGTHDVADYGSESAERTLADTFDHSSDDDEDEDSGHDASDARNYANSGAADQDERRRLVRPDAHSASIIPRLPTRLPDPAPPTSARVYGGGVANDGVFAHLRPSGPEDEDDDEKPPTYEQAAADAAPPYWETTVLAPGLFSDEIYVDGLLVGSAFSFVWNAMISMSFQIVGFLLTYLLHTTHAAKNGSRAGLGITLIQYGFTMKGDGSSGTDASGAPPDSSASFAGVPSNPNSHDFDPVAEVANQAFDQGVNAATGLGGISSSEWLAYILMMAGWFILIRSISDFWRARRHEQLVLQSPDRGSLPVAEPAESPITTTV